jgi:hypothetical protein
MRVLAIAFCLAYKTELWAAGRKTQRQKAHGRLQRSVFALGLYALRKAMVKLSRPEMSCYMTALTQSKIPRSQS